MSTDYECHPGPGAKCAAACTLLAVEHTSGWYDNKDMKRSCIFVSLICVMLIPRMVPADVIPIEDLTYTDQDYNALYESTIASKNRLLKKERLEEYDLPVIYSYTLKKGEDIWTLVARTSLTIDTIATLNRVDFTGELREERLVFLPDTIGLFFDDEKHEVSTFTERYGLAEKDVLTVTSPLDPKRTLLFLPEVQLSFVERTYLTGVVFYAPLMGIETSRFGRRVDPFINEDAFHGGIDIATEEGKKVHAARWGKIVYAGGSNGYGNLVVIEHEFGYHTLYGHLSQVWVTRGATVTRGQRIGAVGNTGKSTGPHLHFEIRRRGVPINAWGLMTSRY